MNKKRHYLNATIVITTLLFSGCETGVSYHDTKEGSTGKTNSSSTSVSFNKIFSHSAQPGFYLQVGFFKEYQKDSNFEKQLKSSTMPYTILQKNGNFYALIGPYTSYNQAKLKSISIKENFYPKAFIIQVLRP